MQYSKWEWGGRVSSCSWYNLRLRLIAGESRYRVRFPVKRAAQDFYVSGPTCRISPSTSTLSRFLEISWMSKVDFCKALNLWISGFLSIEVVNLNIFGAAAGGEILIQFYVWFIGQHSYLISTLVSQFYHSGSVPCEKIKYIIEKISWKLSNSFDI